MRNFFWVRISRFGSADRYRLPSSISKEEFDNFLMDKDVFLNNKQIEKFFSKGEGVQWGSFSGRGEKIRAVVTNITEEMNRDKAVEIALKYRDKATSLDMKFLNNPAFNSIASKLKRIIERYNIKM